MNTDTEASQGEKNRDEKIRERPMKHSSSLPIVVVWLLLSIYNYDDNNNDDSPKHTEKHEILRKQCKLTVRAKKKQQKQLKMGIIKWYQYACLNTHRNNLIHMPLQLLLLLLLPQLPPPPVPLSLPLPPTLHITGHHYCY